MTSQFPTYIEFDYMNFLGISSQQKWTLPDVLSSIAPIMSLIWHKSILRSANPADRLWQAALKSMSSRSSDIVNLITLMRLAHYEGISHLKVNMPYSLDDEQLLEIRKSASYIIENSTGIDDALLCHLK